MVMINQTKRKQQLSEILILIVILTTNRNTLLSKTSHRNCINKEKMLDYLKPNSCIILAQTALAVSV